MVEVVGFGFSLSQSVTMEIDLTENLPVSSRSNLHFLFELMFIINLPLPVRLCTLYYGTVNPHF